MKVATTPRLAELAREFLTDQLANRYGSHAAVESVDAAWRKSPSGHPICALRLRGDSVPRLANLHFRQSEATAANEVRALRSARARGLRVPAVVLADASTANPFGAPFIVREYIEGTPVWRDPGQLRHHWPGVMSELLRLHEPDGGRVGPPSVSRLLSLQRFCAPLERVPGFDLRLLERRFEQAVGLATGAAGELAVPRTCEVNNELHRTRVYATAANDVCIVNWERAYRGDACADLAMLRIAAEDLLGAETEPLLADFVASYGAWYDEPLDLRLVFHTLERHLTLIAHSCTPVLLSAAAVKYFARLNAYCATRAAARFIES